MNNKIKVTIIFLIIIVLVLLLGIIIVKKLKYTSESKEDQVLRREYTTDVDTNWTELSSSMEYFQIKECIEKYYSSINQFSKKQEYIERYEFSESDFNNYVKENLKQTFNIITDNYKKEFNITEENIYEYYNKIYNNEIFIIDKIYRKDLNENVACFIIEGKAINLDDKGKRDYIFLLNLDHINQTFSLLPYEYIEKEQINLENLQQINIDNIESIEKNDYNTYEIKIIDTETVIKEYFYLYKNNLIYNLDNLYNMLDEEYKSKKFNNLEDFKKYINKNANYLYKAYLNEYLLVNNNEEYNEYICKDQNQNTYIFKEMNQMQFKIILDTYTIDLPEFLEKYNSTNEQGKCALNLQKFMQAINDGDYKYAYNCLSEGFKNNYFKTQSDFEKYIEENFYTNNSVNYTTFESKAGVYTYKLELTDSKNEASEKIVKTFVIKLNDGTGFELSFNVE